MFNDFMALSEFWLFLGIALMLAEIILPGLVVLFIGMGSVTVAGLIYFGYLNDLSDQILVWFGASLVYIFSLRFLFLKFVPQSVKRAEINEDNLSVGKVVCVTEDITAGIEGRIGFENSTWPARIESGETAKAGEMVRIVGRDNITYLVVKHEHKGVH
jgi:inner membrane protein